MPRALDPLTRQALAERLRFYRDLGLVDFYRRPVDAALGIAAAPASESAPVTVPEPSPASSLQTPYGRMPASRAAPAETMPAETMPAETAPAETAQADFIREDSAIPARREFFAPPEAGVIVAPAKRATALFEIAEDIGDCKRCPLHKGRHSIVFGEGDANARLMFVGEGPGADEDEQGRPFVGRAGQLLNNMIAAMGLKREKTYICNVVKCRPPGNRAPEPTEANTCAQFLFRQIDVVRPQVIVALGATAATYLLGQRQPLAGLRGRVHAFRGSSLIITYHPAYLLRDPRQKKEAWADLQIAMKELGLRAPARERE